MKFNRASLINTVKDMIDLAHDLAVKQNAAAEVKAATERELYVHTTAELWTEFADIIRKRVRQGEPIVPNDVPASLSRSNYGTREPRFFYPQTATRYQPHTAALEALLRILNACTDDEVSSSALRDLGFQPNQFLKAVTR